MKMVVTVNKNKKLVDDQWIVGSRMLHGANATNINDDMDGTWKHKWAQKNTYEKISKVNTITKVKTLTFVS